MVPSLRRSIAVTAILKHLSTSTALKTVNPGFSQVLLCLVDTTLPAFFAALDKRQRVQLAKCISSLAGIGSVLIRIRDLVAAVKGKSEEATAVERRELAEVLEVLQIAMGRRMFVREVRDACEAEDKLMLWKTFVDDAAEAKAVVEATRLTGAAEGR